MLRVGLTGGLGSGKSTVARMFAARGAYLIEADAIGREMMRPGQPVYDAIVEGFGAHVVCDDGSLDREALARIAFEEGRAEELNDVIHPAVIARQAEIAHEIAAKDPAAVVIVESALIFETRHSEPGHKHHPHEKHPWRSRFDCVILVTAPVRVKIERYIQRVAAGAELTPKRRARLEAEAKQRLAQQIPDEKKIPLVDYVIANDGPREALESQVDKLWPVLHAAAFARIDQP